MCKEKCEKFKTGLLALSYNEMVEEVKRQEVCNLKPEDGTSTESGGIGAD